MRTPLLLASMLAVGCSADPMDVTVDPVEASVDDGKADSAGARLPDVRCAGAPGGGTRSWRHWKSALIAGLGSARHRGVDLVVSSSAGVQALVGEVAYGGLVDKALEGETVDLFACRAGAWRLAGSTISDGEGRFELDLSGSARLPVGLRDLYLSVAGDRSGARFVALVAPRGSALAVSDVDGTLTESENAFPESLVTGDPVGVQPGAPAALAALRTRGYLPVYITARGRVFTGATRDWLSAHGFPRGPLRLAPSLVTLPGGPTVDYKAGAMAQLEADGLEVAIGIGNRATDEQAYARTGVQSDRVFLKLPEFDDEVQPLLDRGDAVGIDDYDQLWALAPTLPSR